MSSYSALAMGLPEAATTERVETETETLVKAESKLLDLGALDLRRAQSETDVAFIGKAPPPAPPVSRPVAAASAADDTTPRSFASSITVQPPTPTRDIGYTEQQVEVSAPPTPPPSHPPPSLPRRPAARFASESTSPMASPLSSPRSFSHGQVPTTSSLGITIHGNVLPAVRSPRKGATEPLVSNSRRARRPRLFGFTGLDSPMSSASSSLANSPENPGSPIDQRSNPMSMLPRRNPVRVKSETSLESLGHASERQPKLHPRVRRDTGLRLDLKDIVPSTSQPHSAGWVTPNHSVVKKKSGEIVKPALKNAGPLLPNGTPVDRSRPVYETSIYESKSCPTTPSCPKYVHFDSQLERVKLFLHDQRPEVVSRQGSPTEDLSDEEEQSEDEAEKILQVKLPNFPTYNSPDVDIYMESLGLTEDRNALRGVVVVRNMSFQKWVTVRFTFDWWQTTSEVSASYKESIRGGLFDRFQFTIQLADLLDRIEEKTLFMCTRYNVNGGEIWDSNHGQNYQVLFERQAKEKKKRYMPKRTKTVLPGMGRSVGGGAWSVSGSSAPDHLADLRAKLNRLNAEDRDLNAPISPRAGRGGGLGSSSPRTSSPASRPSARRAVSNDGVAIGALSSRYDFTSALKTSRLSPTLRGGDLPSPRSPGAGSEFYSPRPAFLSLHGMGPSSPLAGPPSPNPLAESPSSPLSPVPLVGTSSPLTGPGSLPALGSSSANSSSTSSLSSVSSVTVTPSDLPSIQLPTVDASSFSDTSDSAQSETPSPLSPPADSPFSPADILPLVSKSASSDDMSQASYSTFIEQFCWGGAMGNDIPSTQQQTNVRRVHSTSSLDHYFSSPPDLTPRAFTPTQGLSRTTSADTAVTPPALRRGTPPSLEDLARVDSAIRSLSSSLSNTPETSPSITPAPAMSRIPSNNAILTA